MGFFLRAVAVALVVPPVSASAQAAGEPEMPHEPRPVVDLSTCSFVGDNGMDELLAVVEKWNDWADRHDVTDYSAFVMTPWRLPDRGVDVGWFGVWSSGAAMGRGEALWLAEGGDLRTEFESVVDCAARRQFVAIDAVTPAGPPPDHGVMGLRNCHLREGRKIGEVVEAMKRWADYLGARGHEGSHDLRRTDGL